MAILDIQVEDASCWYDVPVGASFDGILLAYKWPVLDGNSRR
jgi:hypothetical protein